jgi:nicotinamidase-related amidase
MSKNTLLTPENCCLHVVDVQESLMRQIHETERVVQTTALMLQCAPILGMSVLANTQYKRGLGSYVPEIEALMEGIPRPDKVEFNALANEETANLVSNLPSSVTTLVLVGVETHICIYQTAMGALQKGLVPWIVTDGVSSRSEENHLHGLRRLADAGAIVGPAEMLIYELLGKAGTATFKEILPLIIAQEKIS